MRGVAVELEVVGHAVCYHLIVGARIRATADHVELLLALSRAGRVALEIVGRLEDLPGESVEDGGDVGLLRCPLRCADAGDDHPLQEAVRVGRKQLLTHLRMAKGRSVFRRKATWKATQACASLCKQALRGGGCSGVVFGGAKVASAHVAHHDAVTPRVRRVVDGAGSRQLRQPRRPVGQADVAHPALVRLAEAAHGARWHGDRRSQCPFDPVRRI